MECFFSKRFRTCTVVFLFLFVPCVARYGFAQETINNGSISGRVTDASGAVVEDAQVTARQTETNLTSTARTDNEGRFRFPYLRLGPYEVTIHRQGFADVTRSSFLTVGSAFEIPVSLTVASAQSSVTVSGAGCRAGDRTHPDCRDRIRKPRCTTCL